MSDTLDLTNVADSSEVEPVVSSEEEVVSDEEVSSEEVTEEPTVTEVVADVPEVVADVTEPTEPSAPSTEEVVENVKEILTTEPVASSDTTELEERVKVLEERFDKLVDVLKNYKPSKDRIRDLIYDL